MLPINNNNWLITELLSRCNKFNAKIMNNNAIMPSDKEVRISEIILSDTLLWMYSNAALELRIRINEMKLVRIPCLTDIK